jgi:cathepsin L
MVASSVFLWSAALLSVFQTPIGQSTLDFTSFLHTFGRAYNAHSEEYSMRKAAFEKNAEDAQAQNKRPNRLWTAGVNDFWDWTPHEMSTLFGWHRGARPDQSSGGSMLQSIRKSDFLRKENATTPLPAEKSWTNLKTMQTIKSQGACGSCWAIAAVTLLEAATELHSNLRTFSAQEIVSCVPNPKQCGGEGGCRGATVELAVDWVMKYGLSQEHQAPYFADDRKCVRDTQVTLASNKKKNVGGASFGMYGWETLPLNKYEPLMRAIAEKGPTAVSVDASPWHIYEKGIFDACPVDAIINHAVVAIGYGIDKATQVKFWHIQNSWGNTWGEKGTIRLLRRDDDETKFCGIDNKPELGTGCKGGPPKVTVCGMCGVLYDSVVVHIK